MLFPEVLDVAVRVGLSGSDTFLQLSRIVLAVFLCQLISHHVNLNVRLLCVRVLLLLLLSMQLFSCRTPFGMVIT